MRRSISGSLPVLISAFLAAGQAAAQQSPIGNQPGPIGTAGGVLSGTYPNPAFSRAVSPLAYGGNCTGSGDDTAALAAALATGNTVIIPVGTCVISAGLISSAPGQKIIGFGPKASIIAGIGNFNMITFNNGSDGGGLENVGINATKMTGGNVLWIVNAKNTRFHQMDIASPYNLAYLEQTNSIVFNDIIVPGVRGSYGIKWYGDASNQTRPCGRI